MNEETTRAFEILLNLLCNAADAEGGDQAFWETIRSITDQEPEVIMTLIWLLSTQLEDFVVSVAEERGVDAEEALDTFIAIQIQSMPSFMIPD